MIEPENGRSEIRAGTTAKQRQRETSRQSLSASVIVCTYTEERWLQTQMALDSLTRQTVAPSQVIVVVDHNPALYELLRAHYPDLEVVPNKFDRGLSGARNTGVQHVAGGDIVMFLDDDARAEPGWLETLLGSYDDESVLGVGGLVLADWSSTEQPGWLPPELLWVVGCSHRGLPETKAEIRNPVGANMSFRRSAFDRAGLFESSMGRNVVRSRPLGCEETEFSIRLLELSPNGRIIYEPRAVVHHHMEPSRGTWRYLLDRCYAEGCSKAMVAQLAGSSVALSSERTYMIHTISQAVYREFWRIFRPGGRRALGRIAALVLGVTWVAAGYLQTRAIIQLSLKGQRRSG